MLYIGSQGLALFLHFALWQDYLPPIKWPHWHLKIQKRIVVNKWLHIWHKNPTKSYIHIIMYLLISPVSTAAAVCRHQTCLPTPTSVWPLRGVLWQHGPYFPSLQMSTGLLQIPQRPAASTHLRTTNRKDLHESNILSQNNHQLQLLTGRCCWRHNQMLHRVSGLCAHLSVIWLMSPLQGGRTRLPLLELLKLALSPTSF